MFIGKADPLPTASQKVAVDRKLLFCFVYMVRRNPGFAHQLYGGTRKDKVGKKKIVCLSREVKIRVMPREKFK